MKIQNKMVKESKWEIEVKKSQYRKVIKAKKRLSPKSRFEPKKQRSPELKTLANQVYFLLPTLGELLSN